MKKLWCILLILFCIPFVLADIEILDASQARLQLIISSEMELVATSNEASVSNAKAQLNWYPREGYNQKILSLSQEPSREGVIFNFAFPELTKHRIVFETLLETSNEITPVTTKVAFPLRSQDAQTLYYTKPTPLIDQNNAIRELAGQIAGQEDDLYAVVFALADWVTTNIEYDLSTITAQASQPSSWVLKNRYGVCDEMTNLFISLNRALGIPARFVSGIAYTNLPQFDSPWGGHGWAEVYFPGIGWVPFDVTYGEYGFVDAGHIKLEEGLDSSENSIAFSAEGFDFRIQSKPLSFDVDILQEDARGFSYIDATLEPFAEHTAIGSYNLLTLTLKNLREFYVSTRVDLGETQDIEHITSDSQNVLLKPYEEKKLHFIVRVNPNLAKQYIYTFPIVAYTKLQEPIETNFKVSTQGEYIEEHVFASYFAQEEKEESPISIECDTQEAYRVGEVTITCTYTNAGTEELTGMACINEQCSAKTIDTQITHSIQEQFSLPGSYTLPVTFSDRGTQKTYFTTVQILDSTALTITEITLPATVQFNEQVQLGFTLEQLSLSEPQDVRITIEHEHFSQELQGEFTQRKLYGLNFLGNRLDIGDNTLTISVEYTDAFGQVQQLQKEAHIALVDLSFGQRVHLWLYGLANWIENLG